MASRGGEEDRGSVHPSPVRGGSALIHHDPDSDSWWFAASAADQQQEESEAVHATSTEAIARATEFLLAHGLPTGQASV